MGIYDREYYRREGPSFLGSFTERGHVCKWLIIINVVVWILQLISSGTGLPDVTQAFELQTGVVRAGLQPGPFQQSRFRNPHANDFDSEDIDPEVLRQSTGPEALQKLLDRLDEPEVVNTLPPQVRLAQKRMLRQALAPYQSGVLQGQVWRLLTYAFLHASGPMHLIFNMLFLWWFGSDVEDLYGRKEFLAFYLVSAFVGGVAYTLAQVAGVGGTMPALGASGAVTAVMVLFALHYPTRIIYLFLFLPVPIWFFVVFQVAQDSFVFFSGVETGTAVTIHLGGAFFAFVYYRLHWRLIDLWPHLRGWQKQRARPRLRVYHEDAPQAVPVAAPPPAATPDVDEQLEAKMDAVLEKVKHSGMGSLTESERQILVRASEVFKRRRS